MAGPREDFRASDAGFMENLRALAASLSSYLQARLTLAGLEGREAFVHFLKILAWACVGALTLVFGYFFLCLAAVFGLAALTGLPWAWVTLIVAVAHLAVTAICAWIIRQRLGTPLFPFTLTEFRKDQEWLHSPTPIKSAS